jgi:1-acyl-sn-glycerol-3-phosphate acyltransferase
MKQTSKPPHVPPRVAVMYGKIPYPNFTSYMHERCNLPFETLENRMQRYRRQPVPVIAWEAVLSRIGVKGIFRGVGKYVFFKLVVRAFRFYFHAFNNLKIHGLQNWPRGGCIFYVNHPGSFDPVIITASNPNVIFGGFVQWGNGWFADLLEEFYGLASLRRYNRQQAIEYMIRLLLLKNRYLGFAPEAHPHLGPIEQGYTTIVPVYAAINHDRDRIPFLPIFIRGQGAHRFGVQHVKGPIEINFLKPFFIDRSWLKKPEEGGKTQREIMDYLMMILARKNGQKELELNPQLEASRRYNENKERYEAELQQFTIDVRPGTDSCPDCKDVSTNRQAVKGATRPGMEHIVVDPTGVHDLVRCGSCGACYNVATREGKTWVTRLQSLKAVKGSVVHVMVEHGGSLKAMASGAGRYVQE